MAFALSKTSLKNTIQSFLKKGYDSILRDTSLIDFKMRNLYTARLRITLFLVTWVSFFLFYPEIWAYSPLTPLAFNVGFLITVICYWNLLQEKNLFLMTLLAMLADVISQAVLVYVMGYDSLAPLLIHGLYVIGAGILYGHFLGVFAAILSFVVYLILFILIKSGLFHDFYYPGLGGGLINMTHWRTYFMPFFLPFCLIFLIYAIKIANHFSVLKQKALERRHVQLAALNNIGATIRKALKLDDVIAQVLRAVIKGLRFETCLLVLLDEEKQQLRFYSDKNETYIKKFESVLESPIAEWSLPVTDEPEVLGNAIRRSMDKGRVVIRNHFSDIVLGMTPKISFDKCVLAQSSIGVKKFVITPLIAEQKAIGVIIGASMSPYIEDTVIDTLEHFSNQAALAIESAELFEELRKKNEQLMMANKVKSDFMAIMSHELRTPLFAVIGYSEILLDRILGDLSGEQKKSVVEILRNAKNLLELINNVLDLSKLESGKMDLNYESFDLKQMTEDVFKTLKPLLEKKSQRFQIQMAEALPQTIADPVKVRQVLINLIGNANKFTDQEGVIEVGLAYHKRASEIDEPVILGHPDFAKIQTREVFVVSVLDNGVGISEKDQKMIFETFQQADNSFTRAHEGTGLGLALTKQLVLLHSGIITVKSALGEGSQFFVVIPQAQFDQD